MLGLDTSSIQKTFWPEPPIYCWPGRGCALQMLCFKHIHKHFFIGSAIVVQKAFLRPVSKSFIFSSGEGECWQNLDNFGNGPQLKNFLKCQPKNVAGVWKWWTWHHLKKPMQGAVCVLPETPRYSSHSMHVILAEFLTLFLHGISMWLQWRRIFSSF